MDTQYEEIRKEILEAWDDVLESRKSLSYDCCEGNVKGFLIHYAEKHGEINLSPDQFDLLCDLYNWSSDLLYDDLMMILEDDQF